MKKPITLFIIVIFAINMMAQAPQVMSYQAVLRNAAGELVANQSVGIKISILQGSPTGSLIYQEIYNPNPQTNANGLISLEIGKGIPLTGDFSGIDWSNGPYYLMTETDPAGGTNYTITGTSQLLSVPYALHANSAENYTETDPVFDLSVAAGITGGNISDWNVAWGWGNHASAGYVPDSRSLNINGTSLDLTANRTWNVGTVSSVGLILPDIFQVSGSPVSESGTLSATFSKQSNNLVFASPIKGLSGSPAFRALVSVDIPDLNWSKITSGKPTTLAGYGITDGVNITENQTIGGVKTFSSLISGSISGNAGTVTNGVYKTGTQTIAGNKTFTGTTTVRTPVNSTDAATKAYVDALEQQIVGMQNSLLAAGVIVKDYDGNVYGVVTIGTQKWMTENLKTTKYNDGTEIPLVTDSNAWENLSTPGYCWYHNYEAGYKAFGSLYNWYTVNTGKLCPSGWHVPSDAEWTTLTTYLGGLDVAGGKLKEEGTAHWRTPNTGATNETGFTALPGGLRFDNGTFYEIGNAGFHWSTTEWGSDHAWDCLLRYNYSPANIIVHYKGMGFSVRCLKN